MPQKLLVTTLIAMQILSWSGSKLYLCFCGSSSCVDFGPAACHCCDSHSEGGHADCTDGRRASELRLAVGQNGDSCRCTHLQISAVPVPAVVDSAADQLRDVRAACVVLHTALILSQFQPDASTLAKQPERGDSTRLTSRASVVLRC
jgi:hypothetical protein